MKLPTSYTTLKRWVEARGEVIDGVKGTFAVATEPRLSTGDAREHRNRAMFLLAELDHHLMALSLVRPKMEQATPSAPVSDTEPTVKAKPRKSRKVRVRPAVDGPAKS